MNRLQDLSFSAVTLAPLAGLMASQSALLDAYATEPAGPASLSQSAATAAWPAALGAFVALVLLPFFLWHLVARSEVRSRFGRILWGLALVLLAPLSHPLYWFTRRRSHGAPAERTPA